MEWQAEKSVNGRHVEGCVHERRPQHRARKIAVPHGMCAKIPRIFLLYMQKNY